MASAAAAAAAPELTYEQMMQAVKDEALKKPKPPPPGSSADVVAAYNDELDSWVFEQTALEVARSTEATSEVRSPGRRCCSMLLG